MNQKQIEILKKRVQKFETVGFEAGGRSDLPGYLIALPFCWGIDPYRDRNWKFQLNTLRYLTIYANLFDLTKEQDYIDRYLNFIKDWADFSRDHEHEFAWNDMAAGIRAENIAIVLGILKSNDFPIPKWFDELVLLHVQKMSVPGFIKTNHNHGLYVIHGLRMLSPYLSGELQASVLSQTREAMIKLFQSQFDDHYIHKEHSPHYHHLVTESLGKHLKTGLYQDLKSLSICYEKAVEHQQHFYLPDGREIPFGDTDGAVNPRHDFTVESKWEFFNQSGYFIAKNINGSYLAITNNYHSNVHKHGDNLSFIFGYCGQDYLTDPGKYKYSKDRIRQTILSSLSHSVVNFRQKSWKNTDIVTPINDFTHMTFSEYFLVQGSVTLKKPFGISNLLKKKQLKWKRDFLFHDQGFLIVRDEINGSFKDLVTRFTVDPSVMPEKRLKCLDNAYYVENTLKVVGYYQTGYGKEYQISPFKILEIPVSKKYAQSELTQQLEFKMLSNRHLVIFIFNESISTEDVMSFYLNNYSH